MNHPDLDDLLRQQARYRAQCRREWLWLIAAVLLMMMVPAV